MAIGPALSVASLGLGAASTLSQANANAQGAGHQAQNAVYAGQAARVNANAIDAYLRDDLRKTLANIDAIRASAGMDPSPTSGAIRDENTRVSEEQRVAKVTSMRAQAKQYDQDAKFYMSAARQYATGGYLQAAAGVTGGLVKSPMLAP
jgi:hypothetical protein